MNTACVARLVALGLITLPFAVSASYFEFCDIEGEIVTSSRDRSAGVGAYALDLRVERAIESEGEGGYIVCADYVDTTMQIVLAVPRGKVPVPGDRLEFQRYVIDTFDTNGHFIGTTIRSRFRALTRTKL